MPLEYRIVKQTRDEGENRVALLSRGQSRIIPYFIPNFYALVQNGVEPHCQEIQHPCGGSRDDAVAGRVPEPIICDYVGLTRMALRQDLKLCCSATCDGLGAGWFER